MGKHLRIKGLVVSLLTLGLLATQAQAMERGKALFGLCIQCHGAAGQGNPLVGAPAIAGLPEWYITSQLEKFQAGGRGTNPNDDAGNRMRTMAKMLHGDDVKLVATYVSSLAPAAPANSVGGQAERGKAFFATCTSCHGANAEGNPTVHAPPLKATSDWYLVHQLMSFKTKVRGSDPAKDPNGATMAPMAATLPDEQAMKDVITYIQSLK